MCGIWLLWLPCLAYLNRTCIIIAAHHVMHLLWCSRVLIVVSDLLLLNKVPKPLRSVRIRSTTLVRLLHGLVLLPSGISGKMLISLDTITIIAMLDVSFLSLVSLPTTCLSSLPKCHDKPLTPPHPSKTLFGYVTACSALLIELLVARAVVSSDHNIIAV